MASLMSDPVPQSAGVMRWVVIVAMVVVKGDAATFERGVYLLYGVVVLALALAFAVPETKQVTPPSPAA